MPVEIYPLHSFFLIKGQLLSPVHIVAENGNCTVAVFCDSRFRRNRRL